MQAIRVLEKLGRRVKELARARGWPVGISVGVVTFRVAFDADEALRQADRRMYAQKERRSGRADPS